MKINQVQSTAYRAHAKDALDDKPTDSVSL